MQASQSQSGCLLSWLAGIFASLFVLLTPFVALLATGDLRMLQPDPYKQALVEQNVYDRLPALLAEQLVYSVIKIAADAGATNAGRFGFKIQALADEARFPE